MTGWGRTVSVHGAVVAATVTVDVASRVLVRTTVDVCVVAAKCELYGTYGKV
jgi:hypothetical protein